MSSTRVVSGKCRTRNHHDCRTGSCGCSCHVVVLCASPGCTNAAAKHGLCIGHQYRHNRVADGTVGIELGSEELAAVRARVEADAAPLFILAMEWIARSEVARFSPAALNAIEAASR